MKKKILFSVMTIAVIGALIGSGLYAYFSDVETAPASFTAGTLNLKVGAADPCEETITIGRLEAHRCGQCCQLADQK